MFRKIEKKDWHIFLNTVTQNSCLFSKDFFNEFEIFDNKVEVQVYLYEEKFLLTLIYYKNKYSLIPFVDIGSVFSLKKEYVLDLNNFSKNCQKEFGKNNLRINTLYCSTSASREIPELFDYVIDLNKYSSIEEIFKGFRKTLRHVLKDNFKSEVKKGREIDPQDFYDLYLKTMRNKKSLAMSFSIFKYILQNSSVYYVKNNDILEAFSLFLENRDNSHYFLSCQTENGRKSNIATKILWQKIQDNFLREEKKKIILGATRVGTPLQTFKEGWNAEIFPIWDINEDQTHGKRSGLFRNIWQLIPRQLLPLMTKIVWKKAYFS